MGVPLPRNAAGMCSSCARVCVAGVERRLCRMLAGLHEGISAATTAAQAAALVPYCMRYAAKHTHLRCSTWSTDRDGMLPLR